ncbi:MAG TPA: hypothetical protein VNI02_22445 [Blastocatellia bacterium]|jgi:hypothetical protein|nr:hypothetical protein [Blastocatellia bacterium]
MRKRQILTSLFVAIIFTFSGAMSGAHPRAGQAVRASDALRGVWAINFIVAVSPKGNDFGQPHRHKFDFHDEAGQRTVVAREIENIRIPGVWRTSGDSFSASFEFTCGEGVTCGTVVMRGQLDSDKEMSGRVVVIWDAGDDTTETGYDTVNGTFTGQKCGSGFGALHDTGGCEAP